MRPNLKLTLLVTVLGLILASAAFAQLPTPNAGFDITGFIQKATVSQALGATGGLVNRRLRGGTLTVNGIEIVVPNNSIVQMPAAAFSWADLFGPLNSTPVGTYTPARPAPPGPARTGLALMDPVINHYPSYEVRVVGNIVRNPDGSQTYIAGLIVPAAQEQLGTGSGYINYIDYDGSVLGGGTIRGRFRVGGIIGDSTTGILCELNDPVGRFGDAHSPDPRFTVDYTNPTVTTANGYPVCIHRGALPSVLAGPETDTDCPEGNRPPNPVATVDPNQPNDPFLAVGAPLKTFTMPTPTTADAAAPNPFKMVPLMVGDWIDYSGTLMLIDPLANGTTVPTRNDPANTFVSVHTLTAHLSVKTQPGTDPAYVRVEEMLFGVGDGNGGPTAPGGPTTPGIAQETSTRALLVAFTTDSDPNNTNNCVSPPDTGLPGGAIFGIYVNPTTGVEDDTLLVPNASTATIGANPGNPLEMCIDDPVRGRMRLQLAKNPKPPISGLLGNAVNPPGLSGFNFYREYVLKLTTSTGALRQLQLPAQANGLPGLIAGQYRLPIFDYLFAEGTTFGQPVPPYNFSDFGFLNIGSGRLDGPNTGPIIRRLDPFPAFQ